jgi:hypothetical protein
LSNYINNGEWILKDLIVENSYKVYSCCPVP